MTELALAMAGLKLTMKSRNGSAWSIKLWKGLDKSPLLCYNNPKGVDNNVL